MPVTRTLVLGGQEVARIGLGTNRLTPANVELVREAIADGIGIVDTAHSYTGGASEETIGAALDAEPERCVIATKGGGPEPGQGRAEVIRAEIDESLRRFGLDIVPLYYLHWIDPETPLEESVAAIAEARVAGKVRDVGLSNVTVEEIERARRIVPVAAVQNHYHLTERTHEDVVDHCAREGIVFVPYFPLKGKPGPVLDEIAERHGATPTQVTLAWLLRRSPAMLPIPGTLSGEHVRENLAALELELTDADFDALR